MLPWARLDLVGENSVVAYEEPCEFDEQQTQLALGEDMISTHFGADQKRCFADVSHAPTSFDIGCREIHHPDCFRASDRLAG